MFQDLSGPSFEHQELTVPSLDLLPELVLRIGNQQAEGHNIESGDKFAIRYATLHTGYSDVFLGQHDSFSNVRFARLTVLLETNDASFKHLALPDLESQRLREYLEVGPPCSPFDCASFAHYIKDVPYRYSKFRSAPWILAPLEEDLLKTGDVVALGTKKRSLFGQEKLTLPLITHLAIYLGDSLYLSKFGPSGKLIVTDLHSMFAGFGGNVAVALQKKEDTNEI